MPIRTEFLHIQVHKDEELAHWIGQEIVTRHKLHHWPLLYVERVDLQNGDSLIYKAQCAAASKELAFLTGHSAPFLLKPIKTGHHQGTDIIVMPFSPLPNMGSLNLSDSELNEFLIGIQQMISPLGDADVFYDFSTSRHFIALVEKVCEHLTAGGQDLDSAQHILDWVHKNSARLYAKDSVGLLHGDLSDANILVEGRSPRWILDWQRPMLGPRTLERAMMFHLSDRDDLKWFENYGVMARIMVWIWYATVYEHWMDWDTTRQHISRLMADLAKVISRSQELVKG